MAGRAAAQYTTLKAPLDIPEGCETINATRAIGSKAAGNAIKAILSTIPVPCVGNAQGVTNFIRMYSEANGEGMPNGAHFASLCIRSGVITGTATRTDPANVSESNLILPPGPSVSVVDKAAVAGEVFATFFAQNGRPPSEKESKQLFGDLMNL